MLSSRFFKPVTVTRSTGGHWHEGRWVDDAPSSVTIRASVQPANERQLLRLTDGQRTKGAIYLYSKDPIKAAVEAEPQRQADIVHHAGRQWEVSVVDPWPYGNLTHWEALAVLIEPEADE